MEELTKINFDFKSLFVPLTTKKAIIFIIIVGLIVYANMLFNGFVWDDVGYIAINPEIHSFNIITLLGKNAFNSPLYYRPLQPIYFAMLFSFIKDAPFFYHILQLIIHISNCILLFVLFKRFFKGGLSLFLTLIFLVHPIQVESISFISQSGNPLLFCFGLIALLLSLSNKVTFKKLIFIFCLLFLSLLTKEVGLLFVIIVVLYRILFKLEKRSMFIISGFAITVLYMVFRFETIGYHSTKMQLAPISQLPLIDRFINIPAIIFYYIKTFFYPSVLGIDQQWIIKNIDLWHFYIPLLIDVLFFIFLSLIGFYLFKINRKNLHLYVFFFIWFILGLALNIQIFPLVYHRCQKL